MQIRSMHMDTGRQPQVFFFNSFICSRSKIWLLTKRYILCKLCVVCMYPSGVNLQISHNISGEILDIALTSFINIASNIHRKE